MTHIRMRSVAADLRLMCVKNADVMQHGGFFQKLQIEFISAKPVGNTQRFFGHALTVLNQNPVGQRIRRIVFANQIKRIHDPS